MITIATDFGTRDGYVGAMKGVVFSIRPGVTVVDITHDISPGDIEEAAFVLDTYHPFFPPCTVHLVVVDPEVGSDRRAIVVSCGGRFYVGPDNGVFESVFRSPVGFLCRELTSEKYRLKDASSTFHGRDIFAPAAAHLASGLAAAELGPEITDPVRLALPPVEVSRDGVLTGRIMHVDRFGNLVSDIRVSDLERVSPDFSRLRVSLAGQDIAGLCTHYRQAQKGEPIALLGSRGRLEVAVYGSNASDLLGGVLRGALVTVERIG